MNSTAERKNAFGHMMAAVLMTPYKSVIKDIVEKGDREFIVEHIDNVSYEDLLKVLKGASVPDKDTFAFAKKFFKLMGAGNAAEVYLQLIERHENEKLIPGFTKEEVEEYAISYCQEVTASDFDNNEG